ncbi:MAG TPA: hypothetical protein VGG33_23550 [Polyangia bacterium]
MFQNSVRTLVASFVLGTMLVSGTVLADDVKVPETAADHEALAKTYREKAEGYRKDAEWHKAMAAAYAKAHPDTKGGAKNPFNTKMQKHCNQLAAASEKLAKESEKAGEFHSLRAKESQGK